MWQSGPGAAREAGPSQSRDSASAGHSTLPPKSSPLHSSPSLNFVSESKPSCREAVWWRCCCGGASHCSVNSSARHYSALCAALPRRRQVAQPAGAAQAQAGAGEGEPHPMRILRAHGILRPHAMICSDWKWLSLFKLRLVPKRMREL